jgi:hypothetical protein
MIKREHIYNTSTVPDKVPNQHQKWTHRQSPETLESIAPLWPRSYPVYIKHKYLEQRAIPFLTNLRNLFNVWKCDSREMISAINYAALFYRMFKVLYRVFLVGKVYCAEITNDITLQYSVVLCVVLYELQMEHLQHVSLVWNRTNRPSATPYLTCANNSNNMTNCDRKQTSTKHFRSMKGR